MKQILAIGYYHHNQTILIYGGEMNTSIKQTDTQYREITVANLPDCYFKEILTSMVTDVNKATVNVVAKKGVIEDWAAYIGYPSYDFIKPELRGSIEINYYCSTLRTVTQVLAYGDKLDKQIAEIIFPEWRDKRYRE